MQLPHLVSTNDLFCGYDVSKLKGEGNIKRKYKCADKKTLVKKIFLRYLYHLMTDLIEGGKVFLFPSKRHMELRFRQMPDRQFKSALRLGIFREIDVLISGFKAYELVLSYKIGTGLIQKTVKLSDNFMQKIFEKINTGYKYC